MGGSEVTRARQNNPNRMHSTNKGPTNGLSGHWHLPVAVVRS